MKTYTIKKGSHYAKGTFWDKFTAIGFNRKILNATFCFSQSCWWAPPRNNDDLDLNKLCGIGYGLNHHKNSVRLAWVPDFNQPGKIKIFGYTYDESSAGHKSQFIKTVQAGSVCNGRIVNNGANYQMSVDGTMITMENKSGDPGLCFGLFPYFGGNNTAPHDMDIELETRY
jgi:hypothetical protein